MKPVVLKSGEGRLFDFGIPHLVKIGELEHGRGIAILELETRHGEEPSEHVHRTEDEVFYVIEGSIAFCAEDERYELEKGGLVYLPKGCRHSYQIPEGETVRLLVITVPSQERNDGWGGYIGEVERSGAPSEPF